MLLGVSRQSVTKWEAERSYPEMDKLLKICQLFGCTLDELVTGDLTAHPAEPTTSSVPCGSPVDVCGYDEHMRRFALLVPTGVSSFILGMIPLVVLADGFDGGMFGVRIQGYALGTALLLMGVIIGLALIIPAGIDHSAFKRAHPYVEDFYTAEQRAEARRRLSVCLVTGIACFLIGTMVMVMFSEAPQERMAMAIAFLLLMSAVGTWLIIHGGLMSSRVNIARRNQEVSGDIEDEDLLDAQLTGDQRAMLMRGRRGRKGRLTSAVRGVIMSTATLVALIWLFFVPAGRGLFWTPWVIGGICCQIVTIIIDGFVGDRGE